jgi:two-component system, chemotaxis family, sensor kinase Cph1
MDNNRTNKKNYDSSFCGSLPLNIINMIQPHGALIVLDKANLQIVQVSENVEELLSLTPAQAIDTPLSQHIGAVQYQEFSKKISDGLPPKMPFHFSFNKKEDADYLALVHDKSNYIILELERATEKTNASFIDVYQQLKISLASIDRANTLQEVCDNAIGELKRISGFDKVMIYQFDEDWNGTTIAEVMEPGITPYLGLRFPASDIPKQARDLYLKNPYRLIPTREYTPVRLYPVINPVTGAFIDLSDCNLRSVPPVHLEYLKNMEVMASMSTRIIKDDRLWGLISCHHRTAKYLDYEMCTMFELLSGVISSKISAIQNREDFDFNIKLNEIQSGLVKQVVESKNLSEGMFNNKFSILDLLNVGGAALVNTKHIKTTGEVPSSEQIQDIVYWLQHNQPQNVYHVNNLPDVYENAESFSNVASGMIVLPIDAAKGEYIIGFRPEVVQEVNWGGNPNEAINFEKDNVTYHPRNSFKLWQQVVRNTSAPWREGEIAAAEGFMNFIVKMKVK